MNFDFESLNSIENFVKDELASKFNIKNVEVKIYLGRTLMYMHRHSNPSTIRYAFYLLTQMFWNVFGQSDWQLARKDLSKAIDIKDGALCEIIPYKNGEQAKEFLINGILAILLSLTKELNFYKKQLIERSLEDYRIELKKNVSIEDDAKLKKIKAKREEITNDCLEVQFEENMRALLKDFNRRFLPNTANNQEFKLSKSP